MLGSRMVETLKKLIEPIIQSLLIGNIRFYFDLKVFLLFNDFSQN